jgi:hypothetical protein
MRRWIFGIVLFALFLGGFRQWLWPSFRSKCILGVCVGKPLPDLSGYGPAVVEAARRGDSEIRIDLRANPPLRDLPMYRLPAPTPPEADRVKLAELLIQRGSDGKVERARLLQSYADGSTLWAPEQKQMLSKWLRDNTGANPALQEINWQRKGIWMQLDRIHGIRTLMQIWPGSGGFATLRVDVGYAQFVPEPTK